MWKVIFIIEYWMGFMPIYSNNQPKIACYIDIKDRLCSLNRHLLDYEHIHGECLEMWL
jgi:hypothetical protein